MNREQRQKQFELAVEDYYEFLELNHSPDFSKKEVWCGFTIYNDPEIEHMWHGFTAAMLHFKLEQHINV